MNRKNLLQKVLLKRGTIPLANFYPTCFSYRRKPVNVRPVVNLKPLNEFVAKIHFKMEGIHLVQDLVKPEDYLATIDLKDPYFSIPIFPKDRKYENKIMR